jgi:AcrR family transcriptional regulator
MIRCELITVKILWLPSVDLDGTLWPVARNRKSASSYHHGDLRDALLAGALKFIEQRGLEDLSLRELARHLGVSSAAPYHHFANRTDLLRALALHGFEQFEIRMREERGRAGKNPLDRLRALGRVYLQFAANHPAYFRLMFRRDWAAEPYALPGSKAFAVLRETVIECLEHGGRGGEDPTPSTLAMWGGVHGIAAICLDGPLADLGGPDKIDSLCEHALGVLVRALKP